MLDRWRKFGERYCDIFVFFFCIFAMIVLTAPILKSTLNQGWDTPPHFYLMTSMIENLKDGTIMRYNPALFGGYPEFFFYGPLPYMIGALMYFLTLGAVSPVWIFNILLFSIPLFFLVCVFVTLRKLTDDRAARIIGIVSSLIWLATAQADGHIGLGLYSVFFNGLFNGVLGVSVICLLLRKLMIFQDDPSWKNALWSGVFLGVLMLTHLLSAAFGVILILIYSCMHIHQFKKLGAMMLASIVTCSFWLIPFFQYFAFSHGDGVGKMIDDPLFLLFPNLHLSFQYFFSSGDVLLTSGLLFAIGVAATVLTLPHNTYAFLPVVYIIALVLLPRDYLYHFFDVPLHYYRFLTHISVLQIFIVAQGYASIFRHPSILQWKKYGSTLILPLCVLVSLGVILATDSFNNFRPLQSFMRENIGSAEDSQDALELINYIKTLPVEGKILAEASPVFNEYIGSVHYFNTMIPVETDHEILTGLLAESTLTHSFINPTFGQISGTLRWARDHMTFDKKFISKSTGELFDHLQLYDIRYVLIASQRGYDNMIKLEQQGRVSFLQNYGHFALFEVATPTATSASLTSKPFVFIDDGGMDFFTFSEIWFRNRQSIDYPVVYAGDVADARDILQDQVSGIIVSSAGASYDEVSFDEFSEWNLPTIILNGRMNSDQFPVQNYHQFDRESDLTHLNAFFETYGTTRSEIAASVETPDPHTRSTDCQGPCILRYNYFPTIREATDDTSLFWMTPSHIFYIGDGENEFRF